MWNYVEPSVLCEDDHDEQLPAEAFRDKVMTVLGMFTLLYSPDFKVFSKFETLFILQDVLFDDEPVPLVGEKRGRDDDDDPIFATGTETGTGDENKNGSWSKSLLLRDVTWIAAIATQCCWKSSHR